jgi:tetratricopeptide (TPR) repeat protein/pimeloyl-ACP methyl ester carboxylesterase
VTRLVLRLLSMSCVIGVCVSQAWAADFDHWSLCMGTTAPETAIKECSAIIDSARELPESLPYAYLYRGRAHLALKQIDPAFADFTAATAKSQPSLAHAHFGLGQVYEQREDWGRAAGEFGLAAASQSEDADIDDFSSDNEGSLRAESFAERGYSFYKKGDLLRALANLEQASKICPTCSAPWRDQALVFDAQHRGPEAAAAADRAIALNPRSGAAFLVRGVNKARAGKTEQAVLDYDEAIRLSPTLGTAYRARANANTKLGRSAQASADAAAALRLEQGNGSAPMSPPVTDPHLGKLLAAPALGDDALKKMLSGHSWQARQGPWLVTLEFRADTSLREDFRDTTEGSRLETHLEGVWGVMRDELCLYTNVGLCLAAHASESDMVLVRAEKGANRAVQEGTALGTVEYLGSLTSFKPLAEAQSAPIHEFPVEELLLHGAPGVNKGPKTLFYYMHGFDGRVREHSPLPEYFVSDLQQSRGWDVIDGNYPRSGVTEIRRLGAANFGVALFLARRIKELKAQGYQRIYVGGQSWGGWSSLLLATLPGLPVDGVVLVVPACCGWRSTGADHDDPNYANNKLFFDQLIERVRYPTVGVFFLGDEYEPADRGISAAASLTQRSVANLMIDHPPGFSGHGSAWFPAFDYLYGACIADFLESPRTGQCPQRRIAIDVGDFRGIVDARQLAKRHLNAATLAQLKGRQFAVYPQGEVREIVSGDQTDVRGYGIGESLESSSFRADSYCIRARVKYSQPEDTDEVCERLMKWSEDELIGLDPNSGHVLQWWVAYP